MNTPSKILTLTTDWHKDDYYTGMLTGRIMSIASDVRIATISNMIPLHSIPHSAFILKSCFSNFPIGSTHLCMVGSDSTSNRQMLVFEYKDHYFIVPNNGIISLITDHNPDYAYTFPIEHQGGFASLDAVETAIKSLFGNELAGCATTTTFTTITRTEPAWDSTTIIGKIIHIDSYSNVITNIDRKLFEQSRRGRQFIIYIDNPSNKIDLLVNSYSDAHDGNLIALFNSVGLLEIAIKKDHVANLYRLNMESNIYIKFIENNLTLK